MLDVLKKGLRYIIFKRKWRKHNSHNSTEAKNIFPIELVSIGKATYGPLIIRSFRSSGEKLLIGNFVSISAGVKFLLGGNHSTNLFTTYPFKSKFYGEIDAKTKGQIIVEDDVWIGTDVLVLSGVKIGKGAIIGAGSIVSKDIPPYSICAGNPLRILKYRFSEDIIEKLLQINLGKLDEKFFIQYKVVITDIINKDNINKLLDAYYEYTKNYE